MTENSIQTSQAECATVQKRRTRSWCAERFLGLFESTTYPIFIETAAEYSKRHRILDFLVTPGKVSAKVLDTDDKPVKVELEIEEYSTEFWGKLFSEFAGRAYFLAKLLAAELPVEIEPLFEQSGSKLFPSVADEIKFSVNGVQITKINHYAAALIYRLGQRLEEDPFLIITMRGCGHDEILSNLRRQRKLLRRTAEIEEVKDVHSSLVRNEFPDLSKTISYYWDSGPKLFELTFNIRADELPASLLKWLDPLPLYGIEERVEFLLEEAYAQVARRAQVFGLGL